jgi:hypothetical protein
VSQIWETLRKNLPNSITQLKLLKNGGKCWEMVGNSGKWWEIVGNGRKWWQMVGNGGKWWETPKNLPNSITQLKLLRKWWEMVANSKKSAKQYNSIKTSQKNGGKWWVSLGMGLRPHPWPEGPPAICRA